MRFLSIRPTVIAIAAIAGALIWGVTELLALQWSRLDERWRPRGTFRSH